MNRSTRTNAAVRYNAAVPTRPIGIGRRKVQNPLHPSARDTRAKQDVPSPGRRLDKSLEEDIDRLPEDSDTTEESIAKSDTESLPGTLLTGSPISSAQAVLRSDSEDDNSKHRPRKQYMRTFGNMSKGRQQRSAPRPPKVKRSGNSIPGYGDAFQAPPAALRKASTTAKVDHNGPSFVLPPAKAARTISEDVFSIPPELNSKHVSARLQPSDETFFKSPPSPKSTSSKGSERSDLEPKKRSNAWDFLDEGLANVTKGLASRNKNKTGANASFIDPSPPKRRKITPEPEFALPPQAVEPGFPSISNAGFDLQMINDQSKDTEDIILSNASTLNGEVPQCPICLTVIDLATMDSFRDEYRMHSQQRLSVRRQQNLHVYHSRIDARRLWQERSYPDIQWNDLRQRWQKHIPLILSIINGKTQSKHITRLKDQLASKGHKPTTLAEEIETGQSIDKLLGYYGARGQRIIGESILIKLSMQLKQQSRRADFKIAGGVGGFVQKVLVPEVIQALMIDDMDQDVNLVIGLQNRIERIVLLKDSEVEKLAFAERDIARTIKTIADEIGMVSGITDIWPEELKMGLANFLAVESAQCGVLLSEEAQDVVPVDMDEE